MKDDKIFYNYITNNLNRSAKPLSRKKKKKKLPIFYRDICEAFSYSKTTKEVNASEFVHHIWVIKSMFKNKTPCFKNWFNKDLKYVTDFVDENGLKPLEFFSNILT